jgi:hypothetical protein
MISLNRELLRLALRLASWFFWGLLAWVAVGVVVALVVIGWNAL